MSETAAGRSGKAATGISGFDRMCGGGLPSGRIISVLGTAGAGKTVFAMQTMANLVREGGMGVFVSFEQSPDSVKEGFLSFDWGAESLLDAGRIVVFDGRLRGDVLLTGAFDIGGLLASVTGALSENSLNCVVFDGIDALLGILGDAPSQRGELLRLQDYAEKLPATVLMTLKARQASRSEFEEIALYMADCVIELERSAEEGMATRSLRIQKYRNSGHAQSRVPILLSSQGIEIAALDSDPQPPPVSNERLSTGIARLDDMMGGGLFRGSSTLLSGSPGTAKTSLGTRFLETMCHKGESTLGIFFDEHPAEIIRNVTSIQTDLSSHITSGLLVMHGIVDRSAGPDEFAHEIAEQVRLHGPRHLLIDPISIFTNTPSGQNAVRRLIQLCKRGGITVMLTSLLDRTTGENEQSRSYVSTICDNWIHLSYVVQAGERNRGLTIVKSRGTAHSNQVGELILSDEGIQIADPYAEDGAVLMGSLRWQKERDNEIALQTESYEADRIEREKKRAILDLEQRRREIDTELDDMRTEMARVRTRNADNLRLEAERRSSMSSRRGAGAAAIDTRVGEE